MLWYCGLARQIEIPRAVPEAGYEAAHCLSEFELFSRWLWDLLNSDALRLDRKSAGCAPRNPATLDMELWAGSYG